MNNKKIIAIVLGLAVIAGVGVYFSSYTQGGLQGFLKAPRPQAQALQINLSPNSPSGSRPVAANETVAIYNLCSNGIVKVKTISFSLASEGDLSNQVALDRVLIEGNVVRGVLGAANPNANQDFTSLYKGLFVLDNAIKIPAGECKELIFNMDTAAILDEDAGQDDLFTLTLNKIYNTDSKEVSSNGPVSANTLKY